MEFHAITLPLVNSGDDYIGIILDAIKEKGLSIEDKDVIVIASKVPSTALGLIVKLEDCKPSQRAVDMAKEFNLDPSYAAIIQTILDESEDFYGGIAYQKEKFMVLWTKKNRSLSINAGVDRKNSPLGTVALELREPHKVADNARLDVLKKTGKHVGISIIDSAWYPLRQGAIGFTIGLSGFEATRDCTKDADGKQSVDIYGRPVPIARHCVADDVAAGAHLMLGEAGERVGAVLARGLPVDFNDKADPSSMYMSENEDPFMKVFQAARKVVERPQWRD